jgi:membrane peptidoglycan carboxypeptidase
MKDPVHGGIVAAATLFLIVSTGADIAIARLYTRGVARVETAGAISEHEFRVFARPTQLRPGQVVSRSEVEDHLRRVGYYAACRDEPGCYAGNAESLTIWPRYRELPDVRLLWTADTIARITSPAGEPMPEAVIEPESILTLQNDLRGSFSRTNSDPIPFAAVAGTPLFDAIVASEDRSFPAHHGFDFARLALIPFVHGGASTITMQVARLDVLQDRSRTLKRKLEEIGVTMAIERLYSKEAILTAYINSVYLGVTRGRPIYGFGAAAREFFGVDDVRQLPPLAAATLVALLNQPSRYLDHLHDGDQTHLRRQRNRVLGLMSRNFPERYSAAWARDLGEEPVALAMPSPAADSLHTASRFFLDHALGAKPAPARERIYLTLDARLQRLAAEVVEHGVTNLEQRHLLRTPSPVQAALVATNPRTGEILAMVGGRSYDESQFNRVLSAERQVGSLMKPFDYLAAFERAAAEGRREISPATIVVDEPTMFKFPGRRRWTPANYGNSYAGAITWRRALAESRNVAAVKIAAWAGIDRVSGLWQAASGRRAADTFPSITLGANSATPLEVATAYAIFANDGVTRPLQAIATMAGAGPAPASRPGDQRGSRVAAAGTTSLVTDMMRAVLDEGTARGARAAGFTLDAAGKTGTTDDLRDAWFAGFSADLLTVVWVGRDDNRPLGLSGAQAALPIWTEFMKRALQ